jgi:membrane carboxypeptidase/penicillin-binding protein
VGLGWFRRQPRPQSGRSAHDFTPPNGVTSVDVCTESGKLAGDNCPNTRREVFIAGMEPTMQCDLHDQGVDGAEVP